MVPSLESWRLRNLSPPFKAMVFSYICALLLAYLYALINVALAVGWTPRAIAIHYYGSDQKIKSVLEKKGQSGEEEFSLSDLNQETSPPSQPSLKTIVAEGHFHLFGMTSFFFGLTLLGLFTGVGDRSKLVMVSLPYLSVILDNISFLMTRLFGPAFAHFTILAGALMFFSLSWLVVNLVREIFWKEEMQP